MIIKNPRNLPDSIVRAVTGNHERNKDTKRFGVNELIGPPLVRALKFEHWDEIEVEVEDMADMMMGSAFHSYMEKYAPENHVAEEKITIPWPYDYTISGIPDCYYDDTLDDYKTTSVWAYIYGDKPEWEAQLNVYRYMIGMAHGRVINNLRVIAYFKDWSARDAERNSDYPPAKLMIIPIPVWELDKTKAYIDERIKAHEQCLPCTDKERYKKPDTFAVMAKGRKSALRVLDTEEEAIEWMKNNKGDSIDHRIGENKRCKGYCNVAAFCPIGKQEISKGETNETT